MGGRLGSPSGRRAATAFRESSFMSTGKHTAAEARRSERGEPLESGEDQRWHDLVSQLGVEIAGPLTAALERIHGLTATG
jgi:hypothetical protein